MSDSEAAVKSSVFALGSLVSSVFGSRVYQSLSGKMQVRERKRRKGRWNFECCILIFANQPNNVNGEMD